MNNLSKENRAKRKGNQADFSINNGNGKSVLDSRVAVYDKVTSIKPPVIRTLRAVLRSIRTVHRTFKDKTELPCFTQSGVSGITHKDDDLSEYNGVMHIDIAKGINNGKAESIIKKLRTSMKHLPAVFRSPSGFVKVLVHTPAILAQHEANYATARSHVQEILGGLVDMSKQDSTGNLARVCFIPHDPAIGINEKSVALLVTPKPKKQEIPKPKRPAIPPTSQDQLQTQARANLKAEGVEVLGEEWESHKDNSYRLRIACPNKQHNPREEKHCVAFLNQNGSLVVTCFSGECKESEAIKALNWRLRIRQLLRGWLYVIGVKQFIQTHTLVTLDKEQFNDRFVRDIQGRNPARIVLSNPALPLVDQLIYCPSKPLTYQEGGRSYFNTWQAPIPKIVPARGEGVEPILAHTTYLIPDERERNIFLDYLAFIVRFPGRKIQWALLLQGGEGIGKSFYGQAVMLPLLGEKNVSFPSNTELHSDRTGWAKHCSLVIVNELMARGRLDLANKLKDLITEPFIRINEKYVPEYTQPNVFNFIIFTNYEDPIPLAEDDRRYCVIYSNAKKRDLAYYDQLFAWATGHLPELLHYFLHRALSQFNPDANAPQTSSKAQLIRDSRTVLGTWLAEGIAEGAWPFNHDFIRVKDLIRCVPPHLRHSTSDQSIGKELRKLGDEVAWHIDKLTMRDGTRPRIWVIRQVSGWKKEPLTNIAFAYAAQLVAQAKETQPANLLWEERPF